MEQLVKIATAEAAKHTDDIDKAIDATLARARRSKWFSALADELVRRAVRKIVQDCRHRANIQMRRENGSYGGPAKVTAGAATAAVARSVYLYMIGGRSLGNVLGEDLAGIGESEAAKAEGHLFNTKLCQALSPLVKDKKTVSQCVPEAKLKKIFEKLQ